MEEQPMDDTTLRHAQLDVRLVEVEGVLQALQRLTQGQGLVETGPTPSLCDWECWHMIETTKPITRWGEFEVRRSYPSLFLISYHTARSNLACIYDEKFVENHDSVPGRGLRILRRLGLSDFT